MKLEAPIAEQWCGPKGLGRSTPLLLRRRKGFFTRYMNFEREFGDETTQNAVMEKATRYVEEKCAASRQSPL